MPIILLGTLIVIFIHAFISHSKKSALPAGTNQEFIKPEVKAFVFYRFILWFVAPVVILSILFFGYSLLAGPSQPNASEPDFLVTAANYLWFTLSLAAALYYTSLHIRYKKEKYFFYADRLIHKGGGIFSDFEKELNIKNITRVSMKLPFIENKLFRTGHIKVESAGALTTEIYLRAIAKPNEIYEKVIETMKKNGFRLNRGALIEQERPHSLAVFFETAGVFFYAAFFLAWLLIGIFSEEGDSVNIAPAHIGLFVSALAIVGTGILTFCIFHFLDLKKRIYDLYEDTIVYSEGFLNKNYAFIPIENLADSTVAQSALSRLFGLYHVKLSCQGSWQEILFKNMPNGKVLSKNIDELIHKYKSRNQSEAAETVRSERLAAEKPVSRKLDLDRGYEAEFRMAALRTWMPAIFLSPLLIVIFPLGIIAAIHNAVAVACNSFKIKSDTIEHTFSFLSKKIRAFTMDKVTGIIFKENFVDKWCGTCSILFWSIGSGESITFSNIKKTADLREKILAKKGIRKQNVLFTLNSSYDIAAMVKGNLYVFLFFTLLIVPAVIFYPVFGISALIIFSVVCLAAFIYRSIYYKKSKVVFYEDYAHFTRGLFFVDEYFVCYDDIKDITTTKFPMTNKGNVYFNVAGEIVYKTQNGEYRISNSFTIRFVDNINVLDELIDTVLYQRPGPEKFEEIKKHAEGVSSNPAHSAKPCLSNYLLFLIPLMLIFNMIGIAAAYAIGGTAISLPLLAIMFTLSALIIAAVVVSVKIVSYNIQPYRVCERSGLIFKKQTSIIFSKMDFINISQGPINKIFGNGNITINTTGSSKSELTIRNIKDFKKFYEIIKSQY